MSKAQGKKKARRNDYELLNEEPVRKSVNTDGHPHIATAYAAAGDRPMAEALSFRLLPHLQRRVIDVKRKGRRL